MEGGGEGKEKKKPQHKTEQNLATLLNTISLLWCFHCSLASHSFFIFINIVDFLFKKHFNHHYSYFFEWHRVIKSDVLYKKKGKS